MLISRAHYPVLTLGYGRRAGVWTQGCVLACEGCIARDTWDANPANDVEVDEVLQWLSSHPDVDGVTVSGVSPSTSRTSSSSCWAASGRCGHMTWTSCASPADQRPQCERPTRR